MREMYDGDLVMDRDGSVSGMIAGDVIVPSGREVRISGMVSGRIINHGGEVRTLGIIRG